MCGKKIIANLVHSKNAKKLTNKELKKSILVVLLFINVLLGFVLQTKLVLSLSLSCACLTKK